ncbi:MAG: tetratricopeptide repeat protein [Saprospiraceae bacterium]|nr:tetratricopeptide repeat protein [Saprospiraceae bacterium]
MKNVFCLFFLLLTAALVSESRAQPCIETAVIMAPALSDATRKAFEEKLAEARTRHDLAPNAPDAVIWLGRRLAYLGQYREAIAVFSKGAAQFPSDARFLRHRGHRLISIRCFEEAIRDLKKAARLTRNRPDEVEPDGLPNARNIPTSSLQSNIWYHLALAYYVQGNFKKALPAWKRCVDLSTNPDGLVSSTNWYYMTLRRLGRDKQATKALATIGDHLDVIENQDYLTLLQLYQGKRTEAELRAALDTGSNTLSNATLGYGFGNWLLYNGREAEARVVFSQVLAGGQWSSFGFIAAEGEQ